MALSRFAKFAWAVLAWNVVVILWGAFVRATGSGAGCGAHWPTCNGSVIPFAPQIETMIEFSHRLSSGVALILVVVMALWAFRAYPERHRVRRGAVLSVVFIFAEALIGAGLVLFQLVAHNASLTRAVSTALHLGNTFLLLAVLIVTAWWASGGARLRLSSHPLTLSLAAALVGTLLIGVTGSIVALGDTLFPAASLAAGLAQDLDPLSSFLIRLRVVHPIIAILVGIGLLALATYSLQQALSPEARRAANAVRALVIIQWIAGFANVALLAPVWMQLLHLLLADLVWIALVLLTATSLSAPQTEVEVAREPVVGMSPSKAL